MIVAAVAGAVRAADAMTERDHLGDFLLRKKPPRDQKLLLKKPTSPAKF
jgi:hypothetical protein